MRWEGKRRRMKRRRRRRRKRRETRRGGYLEREGYDKEARKEELEAAEKERTPWTEMGTRRRRRTERRGGGREQGEKGDLD